MDNITALGVAGYIIAFIALVLSTTLSVQLYFLKKDFDSHIEEERKRKEAEKRKIEREKEYQEFLSQVRKEIEK